MFLPSWEWETATTQSTKSYLSLGPEKFRSQENQTVRSPSKGTEAPELVYLWQRWGGRRNRLQFQHVSKGWMWVGTSVWNCWSPSLRKAEGGTEAGGVLLPPHPDPVVQDAGAGGCRWEGTRHSPIPGPSSRQSRSLTPLGGEQQTHLSSGSQGEGERKAPLSLLPGN